MAKSDTIESLYAEAILHKMFKDKIICRAVYERALAKCRKAFQK